MSARTMGCALPPDGVDLCAELAEHQQSRIEQALALAEGDTARAAKLLQVAPLDLVRMQAGHIAVAQAKQASAKAATVKPDDIPRIERGVEVISRAAIRRLHAEGRTPRQIAQRMGVNPFVIEKVLRAEAELAKCGTGPRVTPRPAAAPEPAPPEPAAPPPAPAPAPERCGPRCELRWRGV